MGALFICAAREDAREFMLLQSVKFVSVVCPQIQVISSFCCKTAHITEIIYLIYEERNHLT